MDLVENVLSPSDTVSLRSSDKKKIHFLYSPVLVHIFRSTSRRCESDNMLSISHHQTSVYWRESQIYVAQTANLLFLRNPGERHISFTLH